jgi:cystathionine beta-lyase
MPTLPAPTTNDARVKFRSRTPAKRQRPENSRSTTHIADVSDVSEQPSNVFPFDVPLAELRRRRSAKWATFAEDVLPLPVAEMDVRLAPPIVAALQTALDDSDTGYPADPGALIAAFSSFAQRRWNWPIQAGDVRVCTDVAVGVIEVLRRVTAPGEAVIITPPVYPRFYAWLKELDLTAAEVPLHELERGGRLDLDGIASAFGSGVRVLLLCNPHNPTGRVHEASELRSLAEIAARHGAIVLSDEIHGPLTHHGATFSPYLTLSEEARGTGFVFTSASKSWNIPGLKCALIVAETAHHERILRRLPHERAWGVGHFGVLASTAAFTSGDEWLDSVITALESNLILLREELARNIPHIHMAELRAGYLAWLDCSSLNLDAEPAQIFLTRGRVGLARGRHFGPPGLNYVRLNFACSREVLHEAVSRMSQALR